MLYAKNEEYDTACLPVEDLIHSSQTILYPTHKIYSHSAVSLPTEDHFSVHMLQ